LTSRRALAMAVGGSLSCSLSSAQSAPEPPHVSEFKTPTGIRTVPREPIDAFTIEFAGAEIKQLSSERLLWSISGKQVDLRTYRRCWELSNYAPNLDTLQALKGADVNSESPAWISNGSHQHFDVSTGQKCRSRTMSHNRCEGRIDVAMGNDNYVLVPTATMVDRLHKQKFREYLKRSILERVMN
jgi:hypothetical protein